MKPKILLIQFRDDETIHQMEYDSFVAYSNLEEEQLVQLHARDELPTPEHLKDYDGLIVAGNGDARMADARPWNEPVKKLIRYAYENNFPTLTICYGAQYTAIELGGKVEDRKEMTESGTYTTTLTEAGQQDPLFSHISSQFKAQQGHNDSITELPEGATLLAYSERAPIQAFTFPNKPFYAVQFHPELDAHQLRFRFDYYKEHYAGDMKEFQDILDRIEESTEAAALLHRFVDMVVVPNMDSKSESTEEYTDMCTAAGECACAPA